ncbi:hypothetical protein [Escherichia coli]|uniref:hypothetical protein n=1 Tax=Escherichia coli TaxID=562 RepID=UPI00388E1849
MVRSRHISARSSGVWRSPQRDTLAAPHAIPQLTTSETDLHRVGHNRWQFLTASQAFMIANTLNCFHLRDQFTQAPLDKRHWRGATQMDLNAWPNVGRRRHYRAEAALS